MDRISFRTTPETPGTLRAVVRGSLIGVTLAFALVAGSLYVSGHGAGTALGIGAMAAFWGGLGFGSMIGGTLHVIRTSDEGAAKVDAPVTGPGGFQVERAKARARGVGGVVDAAAPSGS